MSTASSTRSFFSAAASLVAVLALLLLLLAGPAAACSCVNPNDKSPATHVREACSSSIASFIGIVESTTFNATGDINQDYNATVIVSEVFQADNGTIVVGGNATVSSCKNGACCGVIVAVGEKWLMSVGANYRIGLCNPLDCRLAATASGAVSSDCNKYAEAFRAHDCSGAGSSSSVVAALALVAMLVMWTLV